MVTVPAKPADPLSDPVNLLRWFLRFDTNLRESFRAELSSLDPKAGTDAKRQEVARWMASEGLVDGVTQQPLFTVEQLVAAAKPLDNDPVQLTDQELADARQFIYSLMVTQPYRAQLAKLSSDIAALDPASFKSEDAYYAEIAGRYEAFIEANKRPALTDNLGRTVPASTARLSTIARSLTTENAPVENWWGTYNFVVATYQNATREVTAPTVAITQPAAPSQIELVTSSAAGFKAVVYGISDQGAAVEETVEVPGITQATLSKVLGLYAAGDANSAVPDGADLRMADSGGAPLATLELSAANDDSRYAGRATMAWLVVDQSLQLANASAAGDALLVGKQRDNSAVIEHVSFTAGRSVSAGKPWAEVDHVFVGNYSGSLQLSAPHSRAGQTRTLDPRSQSQPSQAPLVWIGAPEHAMVLGRTSILDPAFTPGAPATLSFARKVGQPVSGVFKLLFTTSPRGDADLQGYYTVGSVTFPPTGTFRTQFELYGDVTLDCMQYVEPGGNPAPPDQKSPAVDTSAAIVVNGTISSLLALITFGIAAKYAWHKWRRSKTRRADWNTADERAFNARRYARLLERNKQLYESRALKTSELEGIRECLVSSQQDLKNAIDGYPKASERGYEHRLSLQKYQESLRSLQQIEARVVERLREGADDVRGQDRERSLELEDAFNE